MKWHFLFISLLQGQAFPKFISGPFFMGTVKYSFGKERRQNSQTVYCTFPWFLGGLANVSWSCLTKEMPGLPLTPRSLSLQAADPQVQLHAWENAAILPAIVEGTTCWSLCIFAGYNITQCCSVWCSIIIIYY